MQTYAKEGSHNIFSVVTEKNVQCKSAVVRLYINIYMCEVHLKSIKLSIKMSAVFLSG